MDERCDVLIVGAGIRGAGIAQAVAAAGHRAVVLERTAVAAETSSRSSRLIHGGLRYLETGQVRLVRSALRERAVLLRIAPDLVRLRPFFFPVYRATRRRPWQLRAGLSIYALLGGLGRAARFRAVPRREWDALDGLRTEGLEAVFEYRDAQTDDALLTRAVMASAQALGAELIAPAELLRGDVDADGAAVRFRAADGERTIRATVLVNAAGPWAPHVAAAIAPGPAPRDVELVQGAHIVVPGALDRGVYYVEAPRDGRAVFVMPMEGAAAPAILVGTTETPYEGDPAAVQPRPEEVRSLAEVLAHHFPRFAPGGAATVRIVRSFAGLRVLPRGRGCATDRSRETIVDLDRPRRPRVVSIYGGKLTTYRAEAERVVRLIAPSLPSRPRRADTARVRLEPPA
jgi:glycerol-3-phosphate dehydrogenase